MAVKWGKATEQGKRAAPPAAMQGVLQETHPPQLPSSKYEVRFNKNIVFDSDPICQTVAPNPKIISNILRIKIFNIKYNLPSSKTYLNYVALDQQGTVIEKDIVYPKN